MNALEGADRLVAASARRLTRRRFLRTSGGLALTTALGTTFLGFRPEHARSHHYPVCQGNTICNSNRCRSGGYCENNLTSEPGGYNRFNCLYGGGGYTQCWSEVHNYVWRCCDCCVSYNTGFGACTNCPSLLYACVCRARL